MAIQIMLYFSTYNAFLIYNVIFLKNILFIFQRHPDWEYASEIQCWHYNKFCLSGLILFLCLSGLILFLCFSKTENNIKTLLCEKDLSLCRKLRFSNPYIFATQCRIPYIFQTMNSGRSDNLSLKYQRFAPSSC